MVQRYKSVRLKVLSKFALNALNVSIVETCMELVFGECNHSREATAEARGVNLQTLAISLCGPSRNLPILMRRPGLFPYS